MTPHSLILIEVEGGSHRSCLDGELRGRSDGVGHFEVCRAFLPEVFTLAVGVQIDAGDSEVVNIGRSPGTALRQVPHQRRVETTSAVATPSLPAPADRRSPYLAIAARREFRHHVDAMFRQVHALPTISSVCSKIGTDKNALNIRTFDLSAACHLTRLITTIRLMDEPSRWLHREQRRRDA